MEIFNKILNKVMVNFIEVMDHHMKDRWIKIKLKEKEHLNGKMVEFMKVIGLKIKCMEKEN